MVPLVVDSKVVAVVVPTAFNLVGTVVVEVAAGRPGEPLGLVVRVGMVGVFSFLWANHVHVLSQFHTTDIFMFVFSALSIVTSILTVGVESVK